jgi:hypothetical protein
MPRNQVQFFNEGEKVREAETSDIHLQSWDHNDMASFTDFDTPILPPEFKNVKQFSFN